MTALRPTLVLALLALATPALAHPGTGHGSLAGFAHPLLGLDHVAAMLAVGLWAAMVGGRALWAWPLAFVGLMLAGAGLALVGIGLGGVELGIYASVLVLGGAIALRVAPTAFVGAVLVGALALFHGHAHGAEMPAGAGIAAYAAGFALATAVLHALGSRLGRALAGGPPWRARLAGGAVAAVGLAPIVL